MSKSGSQRRIGAIQLGEALGRGAFGTVYKGLNVETGTTVAVKRLDISQMPTEEFGAVKREVELLQKMDHPNIIKCYSAFQSTHHMNLVLEFAEAGSLEHMLTRFGPLDE